MKKLISLLIVLFLNVNVWAAANYLVSPAGEGNKDGSTWSHEMGEAEFEVSVEGGGAQAVADGDIYYLLAGEYTPDSGYIVTFAGTQTNLIQIIGVKAATTDPTPEFSDWGVGADRPLITAAGNSLDWSGAPWWRFRNLIITSTETNGLEGGASNGVVNCSIENTNGGEAYYAGVGQDYLYDCELKSTGVAVRTHNHTYITNCYIHDSATGVYGGADLAYIVNNIIDTCAVGIDMNTRDRFVIIGNTIFDSATYGISGTSGYGGLILSNIIDDCAVGVDWSTVSAGNEFDFNAWSNNVDDIADIDVVKGNNSVTADVLVNTTNLKIESGSGAIDAGLQITTVSGAEYKVNTGVDQEDYTSGGNPRHGTKNGGKQ